MSLWKLLTARWGSAAGETDEVRIDASTNSLQGIDYPHHEIHSNSYYYSEGYIPSGSFDDTVVVDFVFTTHASSTAWPHLLLAFGTTGICTFEIYEGAAVTANTGALVVPFGSNRAKCFSGVDAGAWNNPTVLTDAGTPFTASALVGWKAYNITDGSWGTVVSNTTSTVTVDDMVGGTDNDWDIADQYEINRSVHIVRVGQTITDDGILIGSSYVGAATGAAGKAGVPGGGERTSELVLRTDTSYIFRFTSGFDTNVLTYRGEWYEHTDKH